MKNFWKVIFPPRARVPSLNNNHFNWTLEVTYFGWLNMTGEMGRLRFYHPLGIKLKDILDLGIDDIRQTSVGSVICHHEDPDRIMFLIHHDWATFDRNELEKHSSR